MKNISSTAVIVVAVIIGAVLLLLVSNSSQPEPEPVNLPIKVEEFSDFQCPACGSYFEIVKRIREEFGDKIDFEYYHFPITSIHEYAYNAAVATEAAREQGKFEQYHDLLFENQDNLTDEDLLKYAEKLEFDMDKFKEDLKNPKVIARVDADIAEANSRGVSATPTFYINGEQVRFPSGQDPEEKLRDTLNGLIPQAEEDAEGSDEQGATTKDGEESGEESSVNVDVNEEEENPDDKSEENDF